MPSSRTCCSEARAITTFTVVIAFSNFPNSRPPEATHKVQGVGNVDSFSHREKAGMRGKRTLLCKSELPLLMSTDFPLTLPLSLGDRETTLTRPDASNRFVLLAVERDLLLLPSHQQKTGGPCGPPALEFAFASVAYSSSRRTISSAASKACCNATRSSPGLSWSSSFCSSFNCSVE